MSSETVVYNGATDTPSTISGTTTNFDTVRNYPVQWGSWFTQQQYETHADVVVLGLTDVKNLVGENATGSALVGQQVLIGGKSFTVIGVFKSKGTNGFQDQDSIAIMPLTTARDEFTGNNGTVDGLTAQATSASKAAAAQTEITDVLVAQHPGSSSTDFSVLNQQSVLNAVSSNNKTFTVLLSEVAAISLFVGGDRRDEHHVGVGHRAHARDRHPQGRRRPPGAHPHPVPRGGRAARRHRRNRRRGRRDRC